MNVDESKYNFEGFYENFTYLMFINKRIIITINSVHTNLVINSPLSSLSLLVKIIEEEVQSFKDRKILVDPRHLNSFKNSFNEPYKY